MKTIYFTSGLPRSGTTLLQNILAQNPRFYATETSGALDVLFGIRNSWDKLVEHKARPCPERLLNVLRAALQGYCADIQEPVVFLKSRGWGAYLELLERVLDAKAKVLMCIRDIPDVLSSFEKLNRETSKFRQPPGEAQNYFQFQTQEGRCQFWLSDNQPVGLAYGRIMDALQRGFRDRMHFVHYSKLTADPTETMNGIYEFLGEEKFQHNFDHVEQVTQEDDQIHGYIGLHKIHNKVGPKPSDAKQIIGPRLVEKYSKLNIKV